MASIQKRGGSWRVRLPKTPGQPRESATFDTKREAAAWAQQREAELTGKRLPDKTLGDAMKEYALKVAPKHRGVRWELVRLEKLGRRGPDALSAQPRAERSTRATCAGRARAPGC